MLNSWLRGRTVGTELNAKLGIYMYINVHVRKDLLHVHVGIKHFEIRTALILSLCSPAPSFFLWQCVYQWNVSFLRPNQLSSYSFNSLLLFEVSSFQSVLITHRTCTCMSVELFHCIHNVIIHVHTCTCMCR